MFRSPRSVGLLLPLLLPWLAGCSPDAGPLRATWDYVELAKDESGLIKEVGAKHVLRSGGDEMYEIKGHKLEVITVTAAKAKFRLSGSDPAVKKETELQPGQSEDLWLDTFGVRLRVEKIGPIP